MDNVKQAEIELSFIKKVIEDSKKITVDNGMGFILWGILGVAGIILTYADYYLKIGGKKEIIYNPRYARRVDDTSIR